ncbi:MAG: DUF1501 domain-containing protein [Cyanobacteria bacterium TGS_CYA1]|nr:DUF1501 domain-containing protein [Cyanobacteria bacterium TGS_CYA1]
MMKRREFLKLCLASGLGRSLPFVGSGSAVGHIVNKGNQLSLIHLEGGNDAFNTVVPFTLDTYYKERPALALKPESLLQLNEEYGLNPALKNLHLRFKQGQVAIYLGIGYENVSYSHVRASQIWRTGDPLSLEGESWSQKRLNLKLKPTILSIRDFDTHFDQEIKHKEALLKLDEKIGELSKGSICLVYSEMGRSLKENDEGGTDHGHSNLAFLIGEKVRGGIYGAYKVAENEIAINFTDVFSEIDSLGIGRTV